MATESAAARAAPQRFSLSPPDFLDGPLCLHDILPALFQLDDGTWEFWTPEDEGTLFHYEPSSPVADSPDSTIDDIPDGRPTPHPLTFHPKCYPPSPPGLRRCPQRHTPLRTGWDSSETARRPGEWLRSGPAEEVPVYDRLKKQLSCASFSGTFPAGRAGQFPTDATGLVFLEVDFHDGPPPAGWLESEKTRLGSHPAVTAAYVSAGGAGLHVVVAVSPDSH